MHKKASKYIFMVLILFAVSCKHKGLFSNKQKENEIKKQNSQVNETPGTGSELIYENNTDTITQIKAKTIKSTQDCFEEAFLEIQNMLEGQQKLEFKRAVFVSENAFFNDSLNYNEFNARLIFMKRIVEGIFNTISLNNYSFPDSIKFKKNYALFKLLKDTIYLGSEKIYSIPIQYDFNDYLGQKKWSNTFVTKLINTGIGNCHSMPYLYKILANEIQTEAYFALAPNHIYIKHRNKRLGWYNTELTSGQFPTDAWVKASGYITLDAIRSGIYMDTLSQIQSVGLCSYDLAKNYFEKTKNYGDGFVIKCCDLTLKYHPNNINAIILKAETLKKIVDNLAKDKSKQSEAKLIFEQMQTLYFQGLKLGYREMPIEMYQAWLNSLKTEQKNFLNNEINSTFKKNNE